tara:strand:+ start:450 stop:713 length:264 start_codon:yes stop_codon:yes gene_type:complete
LEEDRKGFNISQIIKNDQNTVDASNSVHYLTDVGSPDPPEQNFPQIKSLRKGKQMVAKDETRVSFNSKLRQTVSPNARKLQQQSKNI